MSRGKLKAFVFWAVSAMINPGAAFAAEGVLQLKNPINAGSFAQVVQAFAQLLTKIGIPIAAVFIIWSGFLFVSARGNEDQLKKAKSTFYYTMIGTALLVGAYAIATAIVNFAQNL